MVVVSFGMLLFGDIDSTIAGTLVGTGFVDMTTMVKFTHQADSHNYTSYTTITVHNSNHYLYLCQVLII